jgi:hypothetical protein
LDTYVVTKAGQLWANHFATLTKVQGSCLL